MVARHCMLSGKMMVYVLPSKHTKSGPLSKFEWSFVNMPIVASICMLTGLSHCRATKDKESLCTCEGSS